MLTYVFVLNVHHTLYIAMRDLKLTPSSVSICTTVLSLS